MVDINLFDDEPEEEQGQDDQSFDNIDDDSGELSLNDDLGDDLGNAFEEDLSPDLGGGLEEDSPGGSFDDGLGSDESIDDALGFDDDFTESDNLDEGAMMEEDLSGLDDDMGIMDEEDYDFGSGGAQKNMKWVWAALIIVGLAIVVILYKDMIFSMINGSPEPAPKTTRVTRAAKVPAGTRPAGGAAQPAASAVDSTGTPAGTTAGLPAVKTQNQLTGVSIKLFNELSSKDQFNMMIVDKDRFAVEYASTISGAAGTFADRIKTLTEAAAVVSSPEDAHTVNGTTYYFGVISGKFNPSGMASALKGAGFQNDDAFVNTVKSRIQQQGLGLTSQKKRSSQTNGGQNQSNFEFVVEGEKAKAVSFLRSLGAMGGAWEPLKIRISPTDLNDFSADRVKLVLDVRALVGNAPAAMAG